MPRTVLAVTVLAVCTALPASPVEAQTPDFSGTWVLDEAASRVTPEAGLGALGAVGTPEHLHITHAADGGTLMIEATTTTARGDATSTTVYRRLTELGPCEQWSEPCQSR